MLNLKRSLPKFSDGPQPLLWLGLALRDVRVYRVHDLKQKLKEPQIFKRGPPPKAIPFLTNKLTKLGS